MQATTISRLRRPARATLLCLALWLLLGSFLGVVNAHETWPKTANPFTVPAPLLGDRGVYLARTFNETNGGSAPLHAQDARLEFETLAPALTRYADGSLAYADRVRARLTIPTLDQVAVIHYEPSTRRFINVVEEDRVNSTRPEPGIGQDGSTRSERIRSTTSYEWNLWFGPFCGLRHGLQGAESGPQPADLFGACHLADVSALVQPTGSALLENLGVESSDGNVENVVGGTDDLGRTWHAWFNESIPYPTKIRVADPNLRIVRVQQLVSFERGADPVVAPGGAQNIPPLTFLPRERWGPSEEGLKHPFPLSSAIEQARKHASYAKAREFLSAHPDAYVAYADYGEFSFNRAQGRQWSVTLADGSASLSFTITMQSDPPLGFMSPNGVDPVHYSTSYRIDDCLPCDYVYVKPRPSPAQLPLTAPTVASLQDRWRAVRGSEYATVEPNTWGLQVYCTDNCSRIVEEFTAGHDRWALVFNGVPTVYHTSSSNEYRRSLLTVGDGMRAIRLQEYVGTSQYERLRPTEPKPKEGIHSDDVQAAAFSASASAPRWSSPTPEQTAGAGAFALVVGAIYWLWPAMKNALGGALYTRLQRPDALNHPIRARLLDAITQNPGIHYQELARRFDVGHGALDHHLDKLRTLRLVSVNTQGGYTCYFAAGSVDQRVMNATAALKSDQAAAILRKIQLEAGIAPSSLATSLGLTPAGVHYHLARLRKLGLVDARRDGNWIRLTLTDIGAAALASMKP